MKTKLHAVLLVMLVVCTADRSLAEEVFREDFDTLSGWESLTFPGIPAHSTYTIERVAGASHLRTESDASASGLVSGRTFDVYATPELRWRWKVETVYENRAVLQKAGDDYPLRLYVLFEYDPKRASLAERLKYRAARMLYGEYPPHSTLNYVWSSAEDAPDIYPNPFTDRARMIPLRRGAAQAGVWVEESVHIVEDYRRAFGEDPPGRARIAVMNDSDNTGESAVSWIDWIAVGKNGNK